MECVVCESIESETIYNPINSKIDLQINICKSCGHIFGDYDISKFEETNRNKNNDAFSHLSCESDYSEVRVGKQQMVDYFFNSYEKYSNEKDIINVLDFKSARGDFAIRCLDYFNLSSIDCIEEDEYMTKSYKEDQRINISHQKYYEAFPNKKYDLIYSCHSMEHYRNPRNVLINIHERLNDDGLFYIDVPNINCISGIYNIDDFFYDKHLHYFNSELLISLVEQIGFDVLVNETTQNNIGILFKKSIKKKVSYKNLYEQNKKIVEDYKVNLNYNRIKIQKNCKQINDLFDESKNNAILGCGRALDAMIKYGDLDLNKFNFFIDDFLIKATNSVYGRKLIKTESINDLDGILVLVKNPNNKILEKMQKINLKITYNEIFK